MSCRKYPLYFLLMAALIATACENKKAENDAFGILIEANPKYRNLNDSIRRFPTDAALYMRRASRLAQENAHELAYHDFQKAWSLQPLLENALPLAANLEILGKHNEKLELLETLNRNYPRNPQVKRLLADAYVTSGETKQALMIYNDIIAKDSLDPEILYEKAMLLQQLKDTIQAISTLQRAYAIQKVDTYGLELAHLYAEQKNHKALEICDVILKHDSFRILTDPFFIKGIYYANTKQYANAISQFDSCILRDWKTTDAYLEKGRVYFDMKNFNSAKQTFNMAISVSNSDPDAYYWLGRCYEELHQKTDAINNYRKAISLESDFIEAVQRLEALNGGFVHPSH
ncbi:MAG: tetratricopeptide repeat protein [Bacteroidota bacterium]|nr:tetratricopeptide repeat protein [Bacteroidota bacterium]